MTKPVGTSASVATCTTTPQRVAQRGYGSAPLGSSREISVMSPSVIGIGEAPHGTHGDPIRVAWRVLKRGLEPPPRGGLRAPDLGPRLDPTDQSTQPGMGVCVRGR